MTTYHEFDHAGRHYRLILDLDHTTRGSYGYDTPEETKAAEDEEIAKLNSGEWVVLGCIVTEPCPANEHCPCCSGSHEVDSLWGIVIDNSSKAAEAFVKENMA
jgi:hypothetical protein